jgi:hypothetical protein
MNRFRQYEIENVSGDGNCLFRSLSLGLYGTQMRHAELRAELAEKIAAEITDGRENELFPLGHTYMSNMRGDDIITISPTEYVQHLARPNTWSEEQDVLFAQKFLCHPRSIGIVMLRENKPGEIEPNFSLNIKMRDYDSFIYLVCRQEMHYEILDVGKKKGTESPRAVFWCQAPKLF